MVEYNRIAYTPTEAAEVASVSRPTLYRWMKMDGFPVARIGGCTLRGYVPYAKDLLAPCDRAMSVLRSESDRFPYLICCIF